jgi:hypothetical protein
MSGKLLLAFTGAVILGFESRRTHDHILLSHDSDCLWQLVFFVYSLSTDCTENTAVVAWARYLAMALVLLHAYEAAA